MNPIDELRERWKEEFGGTRKPLKGLDIMSVRPTAFNAPRLPQSSIPEPRIEYDRPGRPSKSEPQKFRKWEAWL